MEKTVKTRIHVAVVLALALLGLPGSALAVPVEISNCIPLVVETNDDRVVVQCQTAGQSTDDPNSLKTIVYFGVSTVLNETERQHANRLLAVLLTALTSGRTLQIRYETNWNDPRRPTICAEVNCRYLLHAALR
jgi:hypothetical protein